MINPETLNKPENIYKDGEMSIIDIKAIPYFDQLEYDLNDEKEYKFFVRDVERQVRNSIEYRNLIQYLRTSEGMNTCAFLDNVSNENSNMRIEIHHSPLTLFDIVSAVIAKRIQKREPMDIELVCEEVMYLHYSCQVGLIPLSETIHEMVHNSYLFVPTDIVRGNYQKFVASYYDYINPEVLDYLDAAERLTKEDKLVKKQMELLNSHKIYFNVGGSYTIPGLAQVRDSIKDRINQLKNNKVVMVEIVNR